MKMNESDERQFSDDKLFHFIFKYLKNNRQITYEHIQNQMLNDNLIKRDDQSWSSREKILHGSDFKKILEFYWELLRRNMIIPVNIDSYGDYDIPFQYRITEMGQKYFEQDSPSTYTDFISKHEEVTEAPNLISHHNKKIDEAISFYLIVKKEIENFTNLKEEEKQFLIKEYFHKAWNNEI